MKKWLLSGLVLVSLLLAPKAWAADWFISPAGSDDSTGTSSGTAVKTFAKAFTLMSAGDRLLCAASGTAYSDGIVPTVHNVQIIGDSTKANKVVVPSISVTGYNQNVKDVVVNGVRVNGNVNITQPWPPCSGTADGFHMRNCVVAGDVTATDAVIRLISNRIGTDSTGCHVRVKSYSCTVSGTVLTSNTIHARPAPGETHDGSNYLIAIWGEDVDNFYSRATCTSNTFQITTPYGYLPGKSSMFRGLNGCVFQGNTFTIRDSTGSTASYFGWLHRDALVNNVWNANTWNSNTLIAGQGGAVTHLVSSGSIRPGHDNRWRNNTFKGDIPQPGLFQVQWQFQQGDSFVYNTVVESTGVVNSGFLIAGLSGVAVVDHNTFYNRSGGGALRVIPADCGWWSGTLILTNNIFYTRSTGTTASDFGTAQFHKNGYALYSDYNLYAHYGGNGARAMLANQCGLTGLLKNVGPNSSRCASLGWDCASIYGSPRFADSSYVNFSPILRDTTGGVAGSAAIGAAMGGDDIGSTPFTAVDAVRPAAITDLYSNSVTTNSVTLRWTDTGDDSLTGTAAAYDLRYSTATITSGNFTAALGMGAGTPSVAGTAKVLVVTGLSANTTYHFSIKARDEAFNWSAFSGDLAVTTTKEGGNTAEP
jgi:hypothetical protein